MLNCVQVVSRRPSLEDKAKCELPEPEALAYLEKTPPA